MQAVIRSALVPYSANQMYELVRDVESYPDFLPWCSGSEILETFQDGVSARVDISKGSLKKSFSTRNYFRRDAEIAMQLLDGPFSQLSGIWAFEPIGDQGSRVSLDLKFDFSSTLARMTIGPVFNGIADRLVDAFVQRANEIYE